MKPTTIEEVLDEVYGALVDSPSLVLTANYHHIAKKEIIATIEQLVLRAIGDDDPVGDEISDGKSYQMERDFNWLKAQQRDRLKQLLGGKE